MPRYAQYAINMSLNVIKAQKLSTAIGTIQERIRLQVCVQVYLREYCRQSLNVSHAIGIWRRLTGGQVSKNLDFQLASRPSYARMRSHSARNP